MINKIGSYLLLMVALMAGLLISGCSGGGDQAPSTDPKPILDPVRPGNGVDKAPGAHCFRMKGDSMSYTAQIDVAADNKVSGFLRGIHESDNTRDTDGAFNGTLDGDKLTLRVDRTSGGNRESAQETWTWDKAGLSTGKQTLPSVPCGQ